MANWRSLRSIKAPSTSGGTSFATFGAIAFSALITTMPASARSRTIDPCSRSKMSMWTFRAACLKTAWNAPVSSADSTPASSSGRAWISSAEPCSIASSTIRVETTVRTSLSSSVAVARSANSRGSRIVART